MGDKEAFSEAGGRVVASKVAIWGFLASKQWTCTECGTINKLKNEVCAKCGEGTKEKYEARLQEINK